MSERVVREVRSEGCGVRGGGVISGDRTQRLFSAAGSLCHGGHNRSLAQPIKTTDADD